MRRAIFRQKSLSFLPGNKLPALEGLKKLQTNIQETTSRLHREQRLLFRKTAKTSFRQGVHRGIDEFAAVQLPFYRDLTPEGIDKLATRVFPLVDTDALDFMTNDNLIQLQAQKQAALKQVQQLADQLKKIPPSGGLHDLTVVEIQEMAKLRGVSLNRTKQDVIDLLGELEPGVDHKALQGVILIGAEKTHPIGPLKNKQQLAKALETAAGEELAEKGEKESGLES